MASPNPSEAQRGASSLRTASRATTIRKDVKSCGEIVFQSLIARGDVRTEGITPEEFTGLDELLNNADIQTWTQVYDRLGATENELDFLLMNQITHGVRSRLMENAYNIVRSEQNIARLKGEPGSDRRKAWDEDPGAVLANSIYKDYNDRTIHTLDDDKEQERIAIRTRFAEETGFWDYFARSSAGTLTIGGSHLVMLHPDKVNHHSLGRARMGETRGLTPEALELARKLDSFYETYFAELRALGIPANFRKSRGENPQTNMAKLRKAIDEKTGGSKDREAQGRAYSEIMIPRLIEWQEVDGEMRRLFPSAETPEGAEWWYRRLEKQNKTLRVRKTIRSFTGNNQASDTEMQTTALTSLLELRSRDADAKRQDAAFDPDFDPAWGDAINADSRQGGGQLFNSLTEERIFQFRTYAHKRDYNEAYGTGQTESELLLHQLDQISDEKALFNQYGMNPNEVFGRMVALVEAEIEKLGDIQKKGRANKNVRAAQISYDTETGYYNIPENERIAAGFSIARDLTSASILGLATLLTPGDWAFASIRASIQSGKPLWQAASEIMPAYFGSVAAVGGWSNPAARLRLHQAFIAEEGADGVNALKRWVIAINEGLSTTGRNRTMELRRLATGLEDYAGALSHGAGATRYQAENTTESFSRGGKAAHALKEAVINGSLLSRATDRIQNAAARHWLITIGENVSDGRAFDDLLNREILGSLGIGKKEWEILLATKKRFLINTDKHTAFDWRAFADTARKEGGNEDIANAIFRGLIDARDAAAPGRTKSVATRLGAQGPGIQLFGNRSPAGTIGGEIYRSQFGLLRFTIGFYEHWVKPIADQSPGLAGWGNQKNPAVQRASQAAILGLSLLMLGHMSNTLRELADGRKPPDYATLGANLAALEKAGYLAPAFDTFRFFGGGIGGPVFGLARKAAGTVVGAADEVDDALLGDRVNRRAVGNKLGLRPPGSRSKLLENIWNLVPGNNLWYLNVAGDRFVLEKLQELADPVGYSQKLSGKRRHSERTYKGEEYGR